MNVEALRKLLRRGRQEVSVEEYRSALLPPGASAIPPKGARHSGKGLAQYHMDQLLNRSPGSFFGPLENGKVKPTPQDLTAIAKILKFNDHQLKALWVYALGHNPPEHLTANQSIPGPWYEVIDDIIVPAYVSDVGWNVMVSNTAADEMFGGSMPKNIMRWMILDPYPRERLMLRWKSIWLRRALSQLHVVYNANQDNDTLQQLHDEAWHDREIGEIYRSQPGESLFMYPDGDERPYNHPTRGPGVIRVAAAKPLSSPGSRLVIMKHLKKHQAP